MHFIKYLIVLIASLKFTAASFGMCASRGLSLFPSADTILQNTMFVLEGYGLSQDIIRELNKKHQIYLESGSERIKLIVIETWEGQYHLTQAVLKAEKALIPGKEYVFNISNLPESEYFYRSNSSIHYKNLSFTVSSRIDNQKPKLSSNLILLNKEYREFGCGPSNFVKFNNPAVDSSEVIVKTTVKNLKSGIKISYYLQPNGREIHLGHGMCSGAFVFEEKVEYEVEFDFMDASGNFSGWFGQAIKFTSASHSNKPIELK